MSYMSGLVGFDPIPGWECVWKRKDMGLVLAVYVDDFKMAGPTDNLKLSWDLVRQSGTVIVPPTPSNHYLGCGQSSWTVPDDGFSKRISTIRPRVPKYNYKQNKTAKHVPQECRKSPDLSRG